MRRPMLAVCGLVLMVGLLGSPGPGPSGFGAANVGIVPPSVPPLSSVWRATGAAVPPSPSAFFTENVGQVRNGDVRFYGFAGGLRVGFAEGAVLILMTERPAEAPEAVHRGASSSLVGSQRTGGPAREVLLRVTFEGAHWVVPVGRGELPQRSHFFLGNDPAQWRTDVRSYREVVYEGLYDGIDLVYRIRAEGPKYDIVVRPGADPGLVRLRYEGSEGIGLDGRDLVVRTALEDLREAAPVAHQDGTPVGCAFALHGSSVGFSCSWDPTRPLVIDPLVYSTFLGGGVVEEGYAITVDSSGNAYVAGHTQSANFPSLPGSYDTSYNGNQDAFVAKLDPSGSALVFSTFLGGGNAEGVGAIALDSLGNVFVAGGTESPNFPTTPGAFDTSYNGGAGDGFVVKLNASGSGLLYSTFLGGGADAYTGDGAGSLAIDSTGNAYVGGITDTTDFPTTPGAFDTTFDGGEFDGFVAKIDSAGSGLVYSTFLGGERVESVFKLAIDASGDVFAAGYTNSSGFPTTPGSYDVSYNGGTCGVAPITYPCYDAFVVKLNPAGTGLVYASYLGGGGDDQASSIALNASGAAYVVGTTDSPDFPATPGALDTSPNGGDDAFVATLNPAGDALVYSTFLGGGDSDLGESIAIDLQGSAHVTGLTISPTFPVTPGAYDASYNGWDTFVAKLAPQGDSLLYSTFFGGTRVDHARSLALDASGSVYITGYTEGTGFPTTPGAYDPSYNGGNVDAFVAKLALAPNAPPTLDWVGTAPFATDGLDPESGTLATTFTYRVVYRDPDGNPPVGPTIHIEAPPGTPAAGCPCALAFDSWVGGPNDYAVGATYVYATTLARRTDYVYSFAATDGISPATGAPTAPTDAPDVQNRAPTANAGPDQGGVLRGALIALDGRGSSDPDGDSLIYSWSQTAGPGAGLSGANTATPSFTPILAGTYGFELTVDDGLGGRSTDSVAVTVVNLAPAANAGPDQAGVFRNALVNLDGTGSGDPDGDALTFAWIQTAGPPVTLMGAGTTAPSFTPTLAGTYGFELTVDDGFGGTSTDSVAVSVVNRAPTANAGPDQSNVFRGTVVSLDGTASSDPEGDPLTYAWIQTAGPPVALAGADTASPSFTPTLAGTYGFDLAVDDGFGGTSTDAVNVVVVNRVPIADAGLDQTVTAGTRVVLSGTGSDPDNDPLTYSWTQIAGPTVGLSGAGEWNPTWTPAVAGTYTFQLTVSDGQGGSAADTVIVTAQDAGGGGRPATDNTVLIVAVIALLVALVLVALFALRRRRKRTEPERPALGEPRGRA